MAKIAVIQDKKVELVVKNPIDDTDTFLVNGEEKQLKLYLVGPKSKAFIDAVVSQDLDKFKADADERRNLVKVRIATLAALVNGWDDNGIVDEPYSPEGAFELLWNTPWLADQVQEKVVEMTSFFEVLSTKPENA